MITVLITDRNLNVVGQPVNRWTNVDVNLRFNEPDTGSITVPTDGLSVDQLAPGNRVVVIRDGAVFSAGPMEQPGELVWSVAGSDAGAGTTTITFASDDASIAAEVAWPDPAQPIAAQTVSRRVFTAANAETAMCQLVSENVGPAALAARRIPGLVVPASAGLGGTVTAGFRMDPLGDALRTLALAGGGLGFRTRATTSAIEFEVYQPRDLSAQVRFSRGLGNLLSYAYRPAAPTATVAIVGDGSGEGTSRIWAEYVAAAASSWGRMVAIVDRRDTMTAAEIAQAGAEALAEGGESAQLDTVTIDTDTQRFGVHYGLGDWVAVELNNGIQVTDIVRAVQLTATPKTGEVVTATVGNQSATTDLALVRELRSLARRLGRLEAI